MSEFVIIETDLAIHPYQGIIGCLQKDWTTWEEPGFIYYFPRDSPITFEIFPGDLILCQKKPIYQCDMGDVLMPIRKLDAKELATFLLENPDVEIIDYHKG